MQVYVQKSNSATRPRRLAGVNCGELSHSVAPSSEGTVPSYGRFTWSKVVIEVSRRSRSQRQPVTSDPKSRPWDALVPCPGTHRGCGQNSVDSRTA